MSILSQTLKVASGELIGISRLVHPPRLSDIVKHRFTRFLQLQILRQLVEHVLCNSQQVREILDRAWGIKHMQHKKKEGETAPPDADDPMSQEHLIMQPIGTDKTKVRYWVVDGQPFLVLIPCAVTNFSVDNCLSDHFHHF